MTFPFDPPLTTSKIAIVGFATESMREAPFDDPACEIWILNMLHAHVPRWDRLWEMHDMATLEQETEALKRETDHLGVLRAEKTRPIYMIEAQPSILQSRRFPIEILTEHFGERCEKLAQAPYFTSTFAYMLATATLGILQRRAHWSEPEDGEEIHICGIELLNHEEYAYQRANAEFLIGYVLGHGIRVCIPSRSALLENDGMYGYAHGESLELLSRMRGYYEDRKKKYLAEREQAQARLGQAKADVNTYDGCVQAFDAVLASLGPEVEAVQALRRSAAERHADAEARRDKAQAQIHTQDGGAQGLDFVLTHLTYLARGGKV